MDALVSIIIPVYNAEKYIQKCINSIIAQTYTNLEIVLVDDGSQDSSPTICDNWAIRDNRVKVIHKENAGPGAARCDGVRIATGDYIGFLDADDYADQDMYKILLDQIGKGFDIVQCRARKVTPKGELLRTTRLTPCEIEGSFQCALHYASQTNTTNYLWNKLYKASLFSNIEYPKLYFGEDSCILTQVYVGANRVCNIGNVLYNHVMTPESLCRQPFSEKRLDNIKAGEFMYEFYSKRLPELRGYSAIHICFYAAHLYCQMLESDVDCKGEKMKETLDTYKSYFSQHEGFIKRKVSSKRMLFLRFFRMNPNATSFAYKLLRKVRKTR